MDVLILVWGIVQIVGCGLLSGIVVDIFFDAPVTLKRWHVLVSILAHVPAGVVLLIFLMYRFCEKTKLLKWLKEDLW